MTRPQFTSVYEEDESAILQRMLSKISPEWRTEPGDFPYDSLAPAALEIKQLQVQQDYVLKDSIALYAEGDALDTKLDEVGLGRDEATPNKRVLSISGAVGASIPAGHRISTVVTDSTLAPLVFTVDAAVSFDSASALDVAVTCATPGVIGNVQTGTRFILSPPLPGVLTVTDNGTTVPGADRETDEQAWGRFDFKVKNPGTGGNKNDYVRWARDVEGVGKARCIPRWNGNGTVKVVLAGTDNKPATQAVVEAAQAYIDPTGGLGDGIAPGGALVTVVAAENLPIEIAATVTYTAGFDPAVVKASFSKAVEPYLAEILFTDAPVVAARIGALLITTPGVSNYSNLTINGSGADVTAGAEQVATLGAVSI